MMLQVKEAVKSFGGLRAVNRCSLQVDEGSITGLIGPNGAGKTTLFNLITGFLPLDEGKVYFQGEDITNLPSYQIAMKGLARTFQTAAGLMRMTVLENLMVAPQHQRGDKILQVIFKTKKEKTEQRHIKKIALEMLHILGLYEKRNEWVENLSCGEIKLLEIARQLMMRPKMLLLDEPTSGVNPEFQVRILQYLRELRDEGFTFFIIEHNLNFIFRIADILYVMQDGQVISRGTPQQIKEDQKVITVYLGEGENELA